MVIDKYKPITKVTKYSFILHLRKRIYFHEIYDILYLTTTFFVEMNYIAFLKFTVHISFTIIISVFLKLKWFTNSITNLYRQCVAHLCFLSSSSSLQKALTLLLISCSIFYVISYRNMLLLLQ